ncbi:sorting nexin-2-like [Homarus americanus]|uniref:sorting nexin-2-like n=1 Tax=Homarus americanus TaxID=6706 RepID=UPI001C471C21|nr:sorting nexin-2-like [Homarus americanus]
MLSGELLPVRRLRPADGKMADSREPPPLFNDDDDSHKEDDNDDLFTSAVQSPVSEQTTPEDCRKEEGANDPLTSPPPAASLTPDPPVGVQPDLFESSEEPTEGGFSSVSLEQPAGGGGMQQVSTEAQDPGPSPLPSPSSSTAQDLCTPTPSTSILEEHPSVLSPSAASSTAEESLSISPSSTISLTTENSLSIPSSSTVSSIIEKPHDTPANSSIPSVTEEQPSALPPSIDPLNINDPSLCPQPFTLSNSAEQSYPTTHPSNSEQEFPASPPPTPTSGAQLDFGMTLPQELSSELSATLVDAPTVEPATMSSFVAPAEEASTLDTTLNNSVKLTNDATLDDQSANCNDVQATADTASPATDVPTAAHQLGTDPTSMHDTPSFLGDGDTTEISLDDNTQEVSLEEEPDGELFDTSSTPKLQLNQDPTEHSLPASSILPPMGAPLTPPIAPITPTTTPNLTPSITPAAPTPVSSMAVSRPSPEQLESESGDEFIQISVSDPQKIGEGISSYMAYKVTTKTNITYFRKKNWSVMRRFSDFLGLHRKLVEKHLHSGRIIPPAPEKSAIGTTKIKLSSDKSTDSSSTDFIEKRRASLERYMNRTGAHPTLRADPDFREFIELDAELPRATQTSALSSAGVLRLFNRVGETVNKMTFKMDESDQAEGQWFEEKTQQIESLDAQLRKLHAAMEGLVAYRRELATSTASFAKSTAVLSSVEEHSSLSRALHQLAESTERTQTIHHAQADADFYLLSETTKDYIQLIGAVKDVFHERVKTFQTWQHAQAMLSKKREAKAKAELAGRMDKVQQAQEEVAEWEVKVERSQEEFERISRAIKKEMEQFEVVRVKDFKDMIVKYLEALMTSQQQITKVWETFIPEAKAIS